MEIGYRVSPEVAEPFEAGLNGLGVEQTDEDEPPRLVAASADRFSSIDDEADGAWIAVEFGGIGGQAIDGIAASISVLHPDGPCHNCLSLRVQANTPAVTADGGTLDESTLRFVGAMAGRLLTQHGSDGLEEAVGTVRLADGATHEVLPVQHCQCGDPKGRYDRPEDDIPPGGDPLTRAERAVDELVGPIVQVGEQESYPAPYYVAELADTRGFSELRAAQYAAGIDLDWDQAFMRAIGEGLERYCAGVYRQDYLLAVPTDNAIGLEAFPTADDGAEPIGRWWPGVDLHTDGPAWFPVETVVFPPPDGADISGITTGLGLGETWTEAVLTGLLETIERDACMLGWYSTFEPLELEVDHEPYQTLERRMAGEGLASTALLMTQDVDVPVVTAVVHRRTGDGQRVFDIPGTDPNDWPAFAVGSAAAIDPNVAAERALAEAAQNWVELSQLGPERAEEEGAIGEFGWFPRQARALVDTDTTVVADEIGPDGINTPADALEYCLKELEAADLSAYAARTTTRDVDALGFEAVRVLVPEAQPLVRDRDHFTERLRTVPRALGFSPRLDRGQHPYP